MKYGENEAYNRFHPNRPTNLMRLPGIIYDPPELFMIPLIEG